MSSHRIVASLPLLAALVLGALSAQAQTAPATAPAAASAPPSATLDAVTITAQKRKEDVRKVPLSVSVVSGDAIQDNHISDLTDLSRAVPNLSFSSQGGAGLGTFEMRGVSSQAGSATVSIYLDDVSLTTRNLYSQGTAEPRFFDLERVEVLRGPQGTLYGSSSLGGTIRFISKQPDARAFSGNAYTELSTTSHGGTNYLAQAVLNVPLAKDQIGLRIGVQTGHDSGYIDQVSPTTLAVIDKGIDSTHWDVLKLALKAQVAPGWSLTPALFYQRFKSNDVDVAFLNVGSYQLPNNPPTTPALGLFQTSKTVREPGNDKLTVPSLTVNGDVGFGDLTGVLSGYRRRFDRIQDGTYINVGYIASQVADMALGTTVNGLNSAVQLANKTDQTSLELRLASKDYDPARGPLTWVGGVYLARTKTQVIDNEPIFGINAAFTAAGADINDPNQLAGSFPGAFTGDSSYYSARHYLDKQYSLFGELTYNASPTLRGTVGLRALRATQNFTREGDFYYAGGPSTAAIDSKANALTPRFAVNWDASSETSLYANIAKGFRLGAANRPVPATPLVAMDLLALGLPGTTVPDSFKPDSLWSYEIGSKSRLFDNRLSLNVALFHIDWKDIQQDVVLPSSGFDFETNVGRAKVDGIEAEARWRATDALTLAAGASYTHAVFADDTPALGSDGNGFNARKGDPIQGVPKYSARLGFEYRTAAMSNLDMIVRGSGSWTGSSHGTFIRSSTDYLRPGYFTADASVGLNVDRWEFSVFAKNLTNNHRILQQPSVQGVSEAYYLRPRTIGITAYRDF